MADGVQVRVKRTYKECLARGFSDPVAFAEDFLDIKVHDGQAKWLRTRNEAKERCLHCANRYGKSACAGIKLLHRAFYQVRNPKYAFDSAGRLRPYTAINIAMSLDQAQIAWDNALMYASNSPRFSRFIVDTDSSPFPVMYISNGGTGKDKLVSEIWARSTAKKAKYLLGKNFAFINYDEAAFDADGEEVWNDVLRMRLADEAGDIDFTSTPNLKNWFYAQCEKGRPDANGVYQNPRCYTQSGSVFDNPFVDHDFIRETMKYMTEVQQQQNVYGQFADLLSVFTVSHVQQCYKDRDYRHLMGTDGLPANTNVIYVPVDGGFQAKLVKSETPARYVIGIDLARKRDNTVIIVLRVDVEPAELVSFKMFSKTDWPTVYEEVQRTHIKYNRAAILADSTGVGDAAVEAMKLEPYNLPVVGYNFAGSGKEKENLIFHLQAAIQQKHIVFPFIRELYDELIYYAWDDKKLSTDALFALALAWECYLRSNMGPMFDPDSNTVIVATGRTDLFTGKSTMSVPYGDKPVLTEAELDKLREDAQADILRRYSDGEDIDYSGIKIGGLW